MTKAGFNTAAHIWVQWGKTVFISHIITTWPPAYLRNFSKEHNHFPPIISYWFSPSVKRQRQSKNRSYNQRRWDQKGQKECAVLHSSMDVIADRHVKLSTCSSLFCVVNSLTPSWSCESRNSMCSKFKRIWGQIIGLRIPSLSPSSCYCCYTC